MRKEDYYVGIPLVFLVLAGQQLRQDNIENHMHTFSDTPCEYGQIMYGNAFTGHHLYTFSPQNEELYRLSLFGKTEQVLPELENLQLFETAREKLDEYCAAKQTNTP